MNKEDLRNTSVGRWLQGEDSTPLVVRCKDCKWLKTEHCPFRMGGLFTYSYCSFGEREEK